MSSESDSSIMTVGELIDNAFGEPEVNVVHHKLLQSILYLLARQLRVLERRVAVKFPAGLAHRTSSTLSVTEVKLQAKTKKKGLKLRTESPPKDKLPTNTTTSGRTATDKAGSSRTPTGKTTTDKTSLDGGTTYKVRSVKMTSDLASPVRARTEKTSSDEELSYKTSAGKTFKHQSSFDKSSTDKTLYDKTTSDKTSGKRTISDTTSADKISSDKPYTDKKPSDKTASNKDATKKPTTDKPSTDKISHDRASEDITYTDSEEKSTSGKAPNGKTSSDKTPSEKTSADKTTPDITFRDKTLTGKSSGDKTTADKSFKVKPYSDTTSPDTTSADKTSVDKTWSDKTSTDKTSTHKTSADKTLNDKIPKIKTPSDKTSTDKKSSDKTSTRTSTSDLIDDNTLIDTTTEQFSSDKKTLGKRATASDPRSRGIQDYRELLETVEEMRERELRVIRQRADSREEHEKTPTPMASLESVEATYEKLLVVERISSEEAAIRAKARGKAGTGRESTSAPRISVVTQEQFDDLANIVRQIEKKLGPVSTPGFPENALLMQELRKGASLTDAMAALQLSARLEATEKTLKNMLSLVTDMAKQTPGVDLPADTDDVQVLFGAPSAGKGPRTKQAKATKQGLTGPAGAPSPTIQSQSETYMDLGTRAMATGSDGVAREVMKDQVTHDELETALGEMNEQILKTVNNSIARTSANADLALKLTAKLEGRIQASLKLGDKMEHLETLVSNYADQINVLDTGLSSQMTNYQEELTQMQHDLEVGLENMAEMMVNTGGDATAVAELNTHFNSLQTDIDNTLSKQKELKEIQHNLSMDLNSLRRQIEVLREAKSDREEVVDALRDKAGLGELNGLVSLQQFDAVQGDFEKRIGAAYDKFNNQEMVWQRAIDDILRDLNEKADINQVEGLRDEINRHLENMRVKMNFIIDIVGEPSAAALSKKLNRDTACLSCSAPAQMRPEEPSGLLLPALRSPAIGTEAQKPKGDGDHRVCYPGYPITHPRDPRSHLCNRWCGGSHTMLTTPISRAPPGMIITSANISANMEVGTDGKMYAVDKPQTLSPCWQCNNIPAPDIEKEQADQVTPYHLCPHFNTIDENMSSTTPAY